MDITADALRKLGYVKIEHGFSCGRHYIIIDGKTIAQTPGDDIWMRDEDVCDLARAIVPDCTWEKALRVEGPGRQVAIVLQKDLEVMREALRANGYETTWHHEMWIHPSDRAKVGFDEFKGSRDTQRAYAELTETKTPFRYFNPSDED